MIPTAISLFPSKPVPNTVTCLTREGSYLSRNYTMSSAGNENDGEC